MKTALALGLVGVLLLPHAAAAQADASLAEQLRKLDAHLLSPEQAKQASQALLDSLKTRRDAVNKNDRDAWKSIQTLEDWQKFRDQRLDALRRSLGAFPPPPKSMAIHATQTIRGVGFRVENLVFESRPGLWVTANLYRPANLRAKMPGLIIIHSHHNPKTQGELQDMGMTWACLGCYVLVPDQLGHGERRQHPFLDAKSYPGAFKVGRQDYFFRYNTAIQLHLVGESLIGWMAWDTWRGVDVLLRQPGIDPDKIILLGSVAGGGDPAAAAAALDQRIKAVVPFNFGGPQPETKYPLPENAETAFNYLGGGSWESTRGLRLSGRDGFLPWVIVGALAPRGLVYAHEFAWDKERDPVWKRLQQIHAWHNAKDRLASAHGEGSVRGTGPGNTHCNNIGPEHRAGIYPALKQWFDMPIPEKEYRQRLPGADLRCWTPEWEKTLQPLSLVEVLKKQGPAPINEGRAKRDAVEDLAARLKKQWSGLLGTGAPVQFTTKDALPPKIEGIETRATLYTMAQGVPVPVLYLIPQGKQIGQAPMVIGIAQAGKHGFLKQRAETIAHLLKEGIIVCLPDLPGAGETSFPGDGRGRTSPSTSLSASEWMLGSSVLGQRLADLLAIFPKEGAIALWGDSFAPVNPPERRLEVPWDADKLPDQSEPLGGLLALLGGLYHPRVQAIYVHGGLVSYRSVLESPFLYMPHDVVVPGVLQVGDLCDLAATLAPRPLRLEALVDGRNRTVSLAQMQKAYALAQTWYDAEKNKAGFTLREQASSPQDTARWLVEALRVKD